MGQNSKFTRVFVKIKICIWSDPGVNLPVCEYTPVCICVRMRHLLTPSKICTPEYFNKCVFLAHANWTSVIPFTYNILDGRTFCLHAFFLDGVHVHIYTIEYFVPSKSGY